MKRAWIEAGATLAWALGLALIVPQLARADPMPAALQQASALIEQYVQPIAEPEPTAEQKRAIESAMQLLESEEAVKGQSAIEQFLQIGPAALRDLRRLADSTSPATATDQTPTADAYPATMAAIIIRRIEAAQRAPIVQQLILLGDATREVLSQKLHESESAATDAEVRIEAVTGALIQAAASTAPDSPAVAQARQALSEAQAAEKQVLARQEMLIQVRRLTASRPAPPPPQQMAQAPAPTVQPPQQPATPPADVLQIQPISPPAGPSSSPGTPPSSTDNSYPSWFNSGWQNGNGILIPPQQPTIINGPQPAVVPRPPSKH